MKTAESDSAYRLVCICKEKTNYVQCRSTISPLHEKQVMLKLLISMKPAESDSAYRLVLFVKRKQRMFNVTRETGYVKRETVYAKVVN